MASVNSVIVFILGKFTCDPRSSAILCSDDQITADDRAYITVKCNEVLKEHKG